MNNATTTTTTSSNTTNASFADCESSDPESWPLIFDSSSTLANHLEKVQFKIATNKNNHRRLTAKSEEFAARAKGVAAKISNLEAYLNRLSARSTIPPPPSPPPNTINSNIKKRSSINDSPMLTDTNYRRGQASDFSVDDGSPEKKQRISSLLRSSLVSDNSTIGNNSSTTTTTNTHSNVTIPKSTSPPLVIQNHSRPSFSTRAVDFSASSASSPSIPAVIKLKQQQNSSPLRRSLTSFSLAGASSSSSNANANAVIAKRTSVSSAAAAAAPTANITSPVKVKANSRTHLALSVKQPFYMTKYFNRKPRCIIAYPFPATASSASDTLITSSLDGCVQIMDLKGDRPLLQVFKPDAFGNNWTEDIAWVAPDVLALAGKHDEPEPYKQQQPYHHQQQQPRSLPTQLSIIYSCSKEKKSGTFTPFKSSVCNLPQRPHEKGIACLVGGEWTASSNDGVTVFTGGLDKRIVLWDISKEGMEYYHRLSASFSSSSLSAIRSTTNSRNSNYHGAGVLFEEHGVKASLLDSTHTSALQALSYSSDWQYLYSGGLDRRFLARDLLNDSIICNLRLDDQVCM